MSEQQITNLPLVALRTFIQATRDSGYKSTSAAIAELIDNAFEAEATIVNVEIEDDPSQESKRLTITDNGCGMASQTLRLALQF
ncbi:MAG: ATP-binding protein [Candidatus Micrarchaeaceae archaeon]